MRSAFFLLSMSATRRRAPLGAVCAVEIFAPQLEELHALVSPKGA